MRSPWRNNDSLAGALFFFSFLLLAPTKRPYFSLWFALMKGLVKWGSPFSFPCDQPNFLPFDDKLCNRLLFTHFPVPDSPFGRKTPPQVEDVSKSLVFAFLFFPSSFPHPSTYCSFLFYHRRRPQCRIFLRKCAPSSPCTKPLTDSSLVRNSPLTLTFSLGLRLVKRPFFPRTAIRNKAKPFFPLMSERTDPPPPTQR